MPRGDRIQLGYAIRNPFWWSSFRGELQYLHLAAVRRMQDETYLALALSLAFGV
jgi:hypothetical protein